MIIRFEDLLRERLLALFECQHLTGSDITYELRTDQIECTGLRSDDPTAIFEFAQTQRSDTVTVTDHKHLRAALYRQTVCPLDLGQHIFDTVDQ